MEFLRIKMIKYSNNFQLFEMHNKHLLSLILIKNYPLSYL